LGEDRNNEIHERHEKGEAEGRRQNSEVGIREAGCEIRDTGCGMRDAGCGEKVAQAFCLCREWEEASMDLNFFFESFVPFVV